MTKKIFSFLAVAVLSATVFFLNIGVKNYTVRAESVTTLYNNNLLEFTYSTTNSSLVQFSYFETQPNRLTLNTELEFTSNSHFINLYFSTITLYPEYDYFLIVDIFDGYLNAPSDDISLVMRGNGSNTIVYANYSWSYQMLNVIKISVTEPKTVNRLVLGKLFGCRFENVQINIGLFGLGANFNSIYYLPNDNYNDGFNDGYNAGHTDGYNGGYHDGEVDGFKLGDEYGYITYYPQGMQSGYDSGYQDGYQDGNNDNNSDAFDYGQSVGYEKGYLNGKKDGYDNGYKVGIDTSIGDLNWLQTFWYGFDGILSIRIFPGISLGMLVGLPLMVGIVLFLFKFMSKG